MLLQSLLLAGLLLGADAKLSWGQKRMKRTAPPPPPMNRTTTEEDYWKQWNDFRNVEGKLYETKSHHDERFEIFKDNVDKINRHNAQGLSWQMGVTPFADITEKEFKEQIVGGCTLPKKSKNKVAKFKDTSSNPTSVDWVTKGAVTPVKNQGQCGSCWAFSTTGSVEGRYAIAKGTLTSLSEQELVDCAGSEGNNGCRGGLMDYGFEYVKSNGGLCTEDSFPYDAKTETRQCNSKRSACGTKQDPIKGYVDVAHNSEADLESAVAQGPVSIAIEADQTAFQLYKSGVLTGRCGSKLDHGVLAVGYDNESQIKSWKVKNSWGATWGMSGYILLEKGAKVNRGAGQCGLLGQPSYPTIDA